MSSLQYLEVVFGFLSLTELTRFLLSFVLWSFQVLGERFDVLWNKERQEPKLGDAHGTPKIIQGHQKVKAWGCPGRHPLFRLLPLVIYLELYFYSPHVMCFAWSVLYYLRLCLLVCHNHPCCTHLLRETHMIQNLLEYSFCFTYIFWAI